MTPQAGDAIYWLIETLTRTRFMQSVNRWRKYTFSKVLTLLIIFGRFDYIFRNFLRPCLTLLYRSFRLELYLRAIVLTRNFRVVVLWLKLRLIKVSCIIKVAITERHFKCLYKLPRILNHAILTKVARGCVYFLH